MIGEGDQLQLPGTSRRALKRLQHEQERDRYLRAHGYRCVCCGVGLVDDDLVDGVDPRDPRTCMACCGRHDLPH